MDKEPLHILLVDDDEADRTLFKKAVDEMEIKHMVHTVNNGFELMSYLEILDTQLPHLIFLDLNMSRKNGLECLKEIRSNVKLKEISIAIFTTSSNEKDMEETFLHGANIYIIKPDNFNMLKQLLFKAITTTYLHRGEFFNKKNFIVKI